MKILVVTHCFPPQAEVGSLRVARLCRYLPDSGIIPIVLTVQERFYKRRDESLALPRGLRVVRTPMMTTPLDLYDRWRRRSESIARKRDGILSGAKKPASAAIRRQILALLQIPDADWGWYWPALKTAETLVRTEPIVAVFSSAPPWTSHLIACRIKQKFRLPWVADFRDAWAFDPWRPTRHLPRWRDYIDRRLEARFLQSADLVVSVTEGLRENLFENHSISPRSKFVVLTNGFDEPIYQGGLIEPPRERRLLLHAGSLYGSRRIDTFCHALVKLVESGKLDPASFKVLFLGSVNPAAAAIAKQIAPRLVEGGCIEFRCRVDWREAQKMIEGADLLLIFQGNHRLGITAKFYEYLQTGKPIFALVEEGDLSAMLKSTGSGLWADPRQPEDIATKLLEALTLPVRSCQEVEKVASNYHYKNLTKRLADWIKTLSESSIVGSSSHQAVFTRSPLL